MQFETRSVPGVARSRQRQAARSAATAGQTRTARHSSQSLGAGWSLPQMWAQQTRAPTGGNRTFHPRVTIPGASSGAFEQHTSCLTSSIGSVVARVSRPVFRPPTGRETRATCRPSRSELRGIGPKANEPGSTDRCRAMHPGWRPRGICVHWGEFLICIPDANRTFPARRRG